jgi:nondiscriminating glutamyl-tRNA synthetase
MEIYKQYAEKLVAEGKAYYSYSTKEEIDKEREEQLAKGLAPKYSGWDRNLTAEERAKLEAEGRKPSIRLIVPDGKVLAWNDLVRGELEFRSDDLGGDFVILRPDGRPTYNFAVVIDDYLMKITHVFRGEEHISNTPKQLLVYEAFGWEPPQFGHIPLILNQDGKKMSKRDQSIIQFISQYRERGYLPEAVINFIALLGWSPEGEEEIFSKEELIRRFSVERVSKAPAIFDTQKMKWMNNYYIKQAPLEKIVDLCLPYLQQAGKLPENLTPEQREWASRLIALYKEQMDELSQIVELAELFFRTEPVYSEEAKEVLAQDHVPTVLKALAEQISQISEWNETAIKDMMKRLQKETGYKGKQLFMPIRAAVTGEVHGPDLRETMSLLGQSTVLKRVQSLLTNV